MASRAAAAIDIRALIQRNRQWAKRIATAHPTLFPSLVKGQNPKLLWLGCSDSRVPETSILDLNPGDVFVHRNIANLAPSGDISSLSVIQYAVDVIKVRTSYH